MSALLVAGLKLAFLLALWLFIFFIAMTIRTDMFGRTASTAELAAGLSSVRKPSRRESTRAKVKSSLVIEDHPETKITILSGRAAGASAKLTDVVTLGRAANSDLDLDDDYASSHHAKLWQDATGAWVIQDLHSTNGTYVNGIRIVDITRISIDDIIRIGRTQLKLEV